MLKRVLQACRETVTVLLARDPKTLGMQVDIYRPFDHEEAEWKARLLRLHASQERRNQVTRGHGFDQRILDANRKAAVDLPGAPEFAEVFEVERYGPEASEPWP